MAESTTIVDVEINFDAIITDAAKAAAKVEELRKQVKELTKEQGANSAETQRAKAELKAAEAEYRSHINTASRVVEAKNSEKDSIKQLRAELSVVSKQWAELSEEERLNTERGRELTAQKAQLTAQLKAEEMATGDARRNVGNYKESIIEAMNASGAMGAQLGDTANAAMDFAGTLRTIAMTNPFLLVITAIVGGLTMLYKAFTSTQAGADRMGSVFAQLSAVMQVLLGYVAKFATAIVDAFTEPQKAMGKFYEVLKAAVLDKVQAVIDMFGLLGSAISKVFAGDFKGAMEDATKSGKMFVDELVAGGIISDIIDGVSESVNELTNEMSKAAASAARLHAMEIALEKTYIANAVALEKLNGETALQTELRDADTRGMQERIKSADEVVVLTEKYYNKQLETAKLEAAIARERSAQAKAQGLETRELQKASADAAANVVRIEYEKQAALVKANQERAKIVQDQFELELDTFINYTNTVRASTLVQSADTKKSYDERKQLVEQARKLTEAAQQAETEALLKQGATREQLNAIYAEDNAVLLSQKLKEIDASEIVTQRALEIAQERVAARQEFADAEKAIEEEKEAKIQEFAKASAENQRAQLQQGVLSRFEAMRQELSDKEALEKEAARKIGASTLAIESRYSKARKELNKQEFNAKLDLAKGAADNLAVIFGKQTAVGKAAAIASATIDTYKAATAAYASLASVPVVGPGLGAVAATAAIVAGLANVRKIIAVKSGLPGDSGSGAGAGGDASASAGGATGAQSAASAATAASSAAGVNAGIYARGVSTPDSTQAAPAVILPVDAVTAKQLSAQNIRVSSEL